MIFIEWPKFIKQINKYDPLNISIEINSSKKEVVSSIRTVTFFGSNAWKDRILNSNITL